MHEYELKQVRSLSTGKQGIADEIICPFLEEVVLILIVSIKCLCNGSSDLSMLTYVLMRDPSPDILAWAKAMINMFPESGGWF